MVDQFDRRLKNLSIVGNLPIVENIPEKNLFDSFLVKCEVVTLYQECMVF